MMKRRGERGQPCLTPLSIGIRHDGGPPKKGATLTSWRELRTKRSSQSGKAAFWRTLRIQVWSIESKALAVSSKNTYFWTFSQRLVKELVEVLSVALPIGSRKKAFLSWVEESGDPVTEDRDKAAVAFSFWSRVWEARSRPRGLN